MGVYATWEYAKGKAYDNSQDIPISVMEFVYAPEDMPKGEVSLLQRLLDILNKRYTTDIVKDSLDYLLNETIQVYWGGNIYADLYVGSMDANFKAQIYEIFEDVIIENGVSFILKNQDLNGDGYREVALYGTKPLRYDYASYNQAHEYMPWNWGTIIPYGHNLAYSLTGKIPSIS